MLKIAKRIYSRDFAAEYSWGKELKAPEDYLDLWAYTRDICAAYNAVQKMLQEKDTEAILTERLLGHFINEDVNTFFNIRECVAFKRDYGRLYTKKEVETFDLKEADTYMLNLLTKEIAPVTITSDRVYYVGHLEDLCILPKTIATCKHPRMYIFNGVPDAILVQAILQLDDERATTGISRYDDFIRRYEELRNA